MSLISVKNVTAGYGKESVIEAISFEINAGEMVGVLGLNGSGKSTLAKAICGILPHQGTVQVGEKNVDRLKPVQLAGLISYIPQHSGIGIDISVFDVVMMGFNSRLGLFKNPTRAMRDKAREVIEKVGLVDKINANYMQLSEGQKQLVILARALVNESSFMVMDEPESALDFSVRYKLMTLVREWINGGERAGLAILHDISLALNSCDRLILVKDKKLVGMCDLKNDNVEAVEDQLRQIYGDVSIAKTIDKKGKENLVMIHESEGV